MEIQNPKLYKLKLTASLLQESSIAIFELVQQGNFASDLKYLQVSNVVPNHSKLQLNSILDKSLIKIRRTFKARQLTQPIKAPDHTSSKVPCHIPYLFNITMKHRIILEEIKRCH